MKNKIIKRDYCSFEPIELRCRPGMNISLRGDLNGHLSPKKNGVYGGIFEYPAKGYEKGYYEIVARRGKALEVLEKVTVKYTFNPLYFPPRWENVDLVNRFLARFYSPYVEREIIYRYPRFRRDIQMLRLTDPSVPRSEKQIILFTGRVHNPESGMTVALYRFIQWLLEGAGRRHLKSYLFLIIPMTIPITFEEDPRQHNVNREWTADMHAKDLIAIRDKVIDKYNPEFWMDCHSFNEKLDLGDKKIAKEKHGDYIVAFPMGEEIFDHQYSLNIARRLIKAAGKKGFVHRSLDEWLKEFAKGPWVKRGEHLVDRHDPAGIFSMLDYAQYADRGKYGFRGRDWPAMSGEYGYYRCHAVNMCAECRPLHVGGADKEVLHYSARNPDSTLIKLQELCAIGQEHFSGQPVAGFPCQLISTDKTGNSSSAMLTAWGKNRQALRCSRAVLWRNRRSIVLFYERSKQKIIIECTRNITAQAALRLPWKGSKTLPRARIDGTNVKGQRLANNFLFIPFVLKPGRQIIQL